MDSLIRALACMAAAICFGKLLRQPRSTLVFTALIGLLGYAVYQLVGGLLGFFLSGLLVGILCELTARVAERTTTLFLISSIIPTVPGLGLYRTMMALSENDLERAGALGLETLAGIGAIALALTFAAILFGSIRPFRRIP
ncbi:MAG TPA: threonine/serine exporter family protein [Clostridia bacterium]|nr:threonine/serine exporter family protein [Clostridia bacterium]